MRRIPFRGRAAAVATLIAAAGAASLIACSSVTDSLLEAEDPDLVVPGTIQNSEGALALYVGAIGRLRTATIATSAIQEPSWLFSGLLADEWSTSSTFVQNDEVDQRNIKTDNSSVRDQFRALARARTAANQALEGLREFLPLERTKQAEMYFVRGFAEMQMAQDYCNGIPLTDVVGTTVTFGQPQPVAAIFDKAIASYDSAIAFANATDTSTVRILRAARVGKARALLGNNKIPEAAALVTPALVPTTYEYEITFSIPGGTNAIFGQGASQRRYTVSDSLEGNPRNLLVKNVIPFFSLQDPRLPVKYTTSGTGGKDTTKSQDGFTFSRTTTLYGQFTNTAMVNGIDARMVEAEAQLRASNYVAMMAILNGLRAAPPKIGDIQPTAAQLLPLPIPTTAAEAETVYFREKALWTFGRGQRLGDLRRLVRQYNHAIDEVYPTGTHYRGGVYGGGATGANDVNLPVPKDEEKNNPNFSGCLDRKP
jgi:hypothetical protein